MHEMPLIFKIGGLGRAIFFHWHLVPRSFYPVGLFNAGLRTHWQIMVGGEEILDKNLDKRYKEGSWNVTILCAMRY